LKSYVRYDTRCGIILLIDTFKILGELQWKQWQMTELQSSIWNKKYNYKQQETDEQWLDRVSAGNQQIRARILTKQFLFGGRILSNRMLDRMYGKKVTYSNCYVLKPPSDSIWDEDTDDSIWDYLR
jgi:ribonucleoside-diphosphate reductase alpha chain